MEHHGTLANASKGVTGLRLSRNFGHQNAVMAGLLSATGDAMISIDADLQDDIDVIPKMLEQFQAGDEIVYGVRSERHSDTALKRGSALFYYRLLKLLGVDVIHNHADYRLMSRKTVECLKQFSEVNLFLRGIVPLLDFRPGPWSTIVWNARREKTKYNLRRMVALAINGITSFSPAPLRMVAALGLIVFLLTIAMTFWVLWIRLFTDQAVPGWASSVSPSIFSVGFSYSASAFSGNTFRNSTWNPNTVRATSSPKRPPTDLDSIVCLCRVYLPGVYLPGVYLWWVYLRRVYLRRGFRFIHIARRNRKVLSPGPACPLCANHRRAASKERTHRY